jgi:hypothetical protein
MTHSGLTAAASGIASELTPIAWSCILDGRETLVCFAGRR